MKKALFLVLTALLGLSLACASGPTEEPTTTPTPVTITPTEKPVKETPKTDPDPEPSTSENHGTAGTKVIRAVEPGGDNDRGKKGRKSKR